MRVQLRLPFAVLLALGVGNLPPASAGALDLGSLAAGAFVIALGAEDEDEASEGADAAVDTLMKAALAWTGTLRGKHILDRHYLTRTRDG